MAKTILFRVERENGGGMYRPADECDFSSPFSDVIDEWVEHSGEDPAEYYAAYCKSHITPQEDPLLCHLFWGSSGKLYHFAFASREQLNQWICRNEWKIGLSLKGFSVSVYSVDARFCVHGGNQSVFMKSKAHLIDRIDLMSF